MVQLLPGKDAVAASHLDLAREALVGLAALLDLGALQLREWLRGEGRRRMKIVKLASSWSASPAVLDHILSISARQKTDEASRSGPRCPRA